MGAEFIAYKRKDQQKNNSQGKKKTKKNSYLGSTVLGA